MSKFWDAQPKTGRRRKYINPDDLWADAVEYFTWVYDNPLNESKGFGYQGEVTIEEIPKMRAMTIAGLCVFLGIGTSTFDDYSKKVDFSEVCTKIKEVIYVQKFEGASAGLLSPAIIARDLGLADKQESNVVLTEKKDLNDFYADQAQSNT